MSRLMDWVRDRLGVPHTPDWERESVERRLDEQERRLRMIDAGLPADRRHFVATHHPIRRVGDRR